LEEGQTSAVPLSRREPGGLLVEPERDSAIIGGALAEAAPHVGRPW
jgi:hypothetical protein